MVTRSRDEAPSTAVPDGSDGSDPESVAVTAARRAGVSVRALETPTDLTAAAELAARVWKTADTSQLHVTLLRALAHTGNFVAGAFESRGAGRVGDLVGMSVGFATMRPASSLHSHMTCTADDRRDRGLGYAMKLYQRAWAAHAGLTSVTWTFDPLVRRNAYFNFVKLDARAVGYVTDFYGAMGDGLNSGQESDRLLMVWPVESDPNRPGPASRSDQPPPECDVVLTVGPDDAPMRSGSDADRIACQVPLDVVSLRAQSPRAASKWRSALRDVLGSAMSDGYRIDGFTRSGHYLLRRRPPEAAAAGA